MDLSRIKKQTSEIDLNLFNLLLSIDRLLQVVDSDTNCLHLVNDDKVLDDLDTLDVIQQAVKCFKQSIRKDISTFYAAYSFLTNHEPPHIKLIYELESQIQ